MKCVENIMLGRACHVAALRGACCGGQDYRRSSTPTARIEHAMCPKRVRRLCRVAHDIACTAQYIFHVVSVWPAPNEMDASTLVDRWLQVPLALPLLLVFRKAELQQASSCDYGLCRTHKESLKDNGFSILRWRSRLPILRSRGVPTRSLAGVGRI